MSGNLNLPAVAKEYVRKLLAEAGAGMKVLVLDDVTMNVVSAVMSQTQILEQEVFLVEKLSPTPHEPMQHLKAVCLIRPVHENIALLRQQMRNRIYGEYHVFFSNVLRDAYLQELAEADEDKVIQQVQEYFADFQAIDRELFTLDLKNNHLFLQPPTWNSQGTQHAMDRAVEGVASVLLSLKRRPVIRHSRNSEVARRIATDIKHIAYEQESGLFDFRRGDGTLLLLVLDRLDDPVTPLLAQWTYQAMVHELIGIDNNRVSLHDAITKVPKDAREFVFSADQDSFLRENMYVNYGDLAQNVKALVDEFQAVSNSNKQIDSIEDMQRFVESYPEFRQKSGNVSKHVALMSELSAVVAKKTLMPVSQVEQEVACGSDRSYAFASVMEQIESPTVGDAEKLRLAALFALRHEKEGSRQVEDIKEMLANQGMGRARLGLLDGMMRHAGEAKRTGDLFGNKSFLSRASKMVGGMKGVDNVYTQHSPLLHTTLDNLMKGKLRDADYPVIAGTGAGGAGGGSGGGKEPVPRDVLVFIAGGVTYEEARFVHQINASNTSGFNVVLGGTSVLSADKFVGDVMDMLDSAGGR